MKKVYVSRMAKASRKHHRQLLEFLSQTLQEPVEKLCGELAGQVEQLGAQLGLALMRSLLDQEVEQRLGVWGEQSHYRHGAQAGYAFWGGRKVSLQRPRLRRKDGREARLRTYQSFQKNGRQQQAVARLLLRGCSTRQYSGALDDCLEGYGIAKSSISRQWKEATEKQLQELCQRPVPKDLVVLFLDSKHYAEDCIVVAVGVDQAGKKHLLGLWQGATENTTVVSALLADLVERGLSTDRRLLVVIDGARALRRALQTVLGERAIVQRCRFHKQRNVVEHLPPDKQAQAIWRLHAAWEQTDATKAEKELRAVVRWLEAINPMAARSLEEGLEETLTLQRLGVNDLLSKSLATTNAIESCMSRFAGSTRRVTRWRRGRGKMLLRWAASALLFAEKGFRRTKGYQHLPALEAALQKINLAFLQKAA